MALPSLTTRKLASRWPATIARFIPRIARPRSEVLVSRRSFARALLDQIAAGRIARSDLTAFHARQIRSLGDAALSEQLSTVWGEIRVSESNRRDQITRLKQKLDRTALAQAELGRGRVVFDRVCATCHKLYGNGGEIGPDLTGSGRDNLDYLLENIVDPSAVVTADFRMVVAAMRDGRVLNGLIKAQSPRTLTLQTQTTAHEPRPIRDRIHAAVGFFVDAGRIAGHVDAGGDS